MKSNSRIHEVDGIDKGEYLALMAFSADEFILTVVEPEEYGDDRQAAAMTLTRTQMHSLISSAIVVLSETMEEHHNDS